MNKENIILVLFSLLFILQLVNASETIYTQYNYNLLEIKDLSYKTNNVWYKAKTVDSPESYIVDYKNKTKTIQVHLSGFNKDQPVFAIITTPEKLYDIDTELNDILDKINNFYLNNPASNIKESAKTHSFKNYANQSNYIINNTFKIDYWDSINFNLGTQNQFEFNIEKGTENNLFVLIFMQFSDDSQLINLAYVNLYVLDNRELSIFNLCKINRKIVDFYCKGEKCNIPKSCLDRWDFDAIKFTRAPVIKEDPVPITEEKQSDKPTTYHSTINSQIGLKILNQAEKYLGRKYKWEGRNGYTVKGIGKLKSDFDCVGLKYVVLRDLGYLDDSASCLQMFSSGCAFADYLENNKGHIKGIVGNIKNKSDLDNLKPGDFLSLNTKSAGIFGHAAIYVGVESGKHKYIHASGSKKIAGSVKYDYLEDKLSKGTLKYPFQYQRITGFNSSNIDCSKNYISVSKDFSGCCKYTTYC